jgi:hypothetical protein
MSLAVLARLQRARAYTIKGESPKVLGSYRDFLALWKEANRKTPVPVKASAESAQLQSATRRQQR